MGFGTLIREHRQHAGVPLNQFSAALGISAAYWSRIEREQEKPPTDALISAAAAQLGVPLDTAFVAAQRVPPDLRHRLREMVQLYRQMATRA